MTVCVLKFMRVIQLRDDKETPLLYMLEGIECNTSLHSKNIYIYSNSPVSAKLESVSLVMWNVDKAAQRLKSVLRGSLMPVVSSACCGATDE